MKQRTKPIEQMIQFIGGMHTYIKTGYEVIEEWECENCGKVYMVELEVCGR